MAFLSLITFAKRLSTMMLVASVVLSYAACSSEPKSRAGKVASAGGGSDDCDEKAALASSSGKKKKGASLTTKCAGGTTTAGKKGDDDDDGPAKPSGSGTGTGDDDDDDDGLAATANWLEGIKAMSDDEAIDYLKDKCASCHNSKNGSVKSFWTLDEAKISKDTLVAATDTARVYAAVVFGAKQIVGQKPSPMPQGTANWKDAQIDELKGLVKWFEEQMPTVAEAGASQFGIASDADGAGGTGVMLNFKCANPSTFRQFIARVTNDAFTRPPTADEIALAEDPDAKASKADREKVAAKIFSDKKWKADFVKNGLKKFADKIAGVSGISEYVYKVPPDAATETVQVSKEQATDLKLEFYEKLKKDWEDVPYQDILLSNKVMVTSDTAPLYGCSAPSDDWGECEMKKPRDSFFTTVGYLRSKPSTVLSLNNNYGRAALMIFIIRGDVFKSATNDDGGSEKINPLPDCLKTNDHRVKVNDASISPFGATSIPNSANLCQSCHIDRQMAAGSILFRPFTRGGLVYKKGDATLDLEKDEVFAEAVDPAQKLFNRPDGPSKSSGESAVAAPFLQDLVTKRLDNSEYGCVPAAGDQEKVELKEVGDLAKFLIGNGRVLAGGLARHVPRAISNVDSTSEEIVLKFNRAFKENDGKLAPLLEAYFASETFACEKGQ